MSIKSPQRRLQFRKLRTRAQVHGTPERPRLSVYRSSKNIYAQIIDDVAGRTLTEASTLSVEAKTGANVEAAKKVGQAIAQKAKGLKIEKVVFDRAGRPFHGRVKAVADGAREAGLQF